VQQSSLLGASIVWVVGAAKLEDRIHAPVSSCADKVFQPSTCKCTLEACICAELRCYSAFPSQLAMLTQEDELNKGDKGIRKMPTPSCSIYGLTRPWAHALCAIPGVMISTQSHTPFSTQMHAHAHTNGLFVNYYRFNMTTPGTVFSTPKQTQTLSGAALLPENLKTLDFGRA